jgi:hypothetical protein
MCLALEKITEETLPGSPAIPDMGIGAPDGVDALVVLPECPGRIRQFTFASARRRERR